MGQRGALLLSELLLLLLTASCTLLAVSFPEDSAPLDIVDAHCEYAHANDPGGDVNAASRENADKHDISLLHTAATDLYVHTQYLYHQLLQPNACVSSPAQFHGGTRCSEAGPLETSRSIALTFS